MQTTGNSNRPLMQARGLYPQHGRITTYESEFQASAGPHDTTQLTIGVGEALEYVAKESVDDVQHLEIVLPDLHLKIQPRELAQMPVRVRLFSPACSKE